MAGRQQLGGRWFRCLVASLAELPRLSAPRPGPEQALAAVPAPWQCCSSASATTPLLNSRLSSYEAAAEQEVSFRIFSVHRLRMQVRQVTQVTGLPRTPPGDTDRAPCIAVSTLSCKVDSVWRAPRGVDLFGEISQTRACRCRSLIVDKRPGLLGFACEVGPWSTMVDIGNEHDPSRYGSG